MKRYLLLGNTELDITWLRHTPKGHVTLRQSVPVKLYVQMPEGYTGPSQDIQINMQCAPISFNVPDGQWLTIVPETKLPPTQAYITLDE